MDKNLIKYLKKSKNIRITNDNTVCYFALFNGIIFLSGNEYDNITFNINYRDKTIGGSGKAIKLGSACELNIERSRILYKSPMAAKLLSENMYIYRIELKYIEVENYHISVDPDDLNEKQHFILRSIRPWSFQQSAVAVILGAVLAFHINLFYLIISIVAVLMAQSSFNILNGYFDYKSGNDTVTSMTATRIFVDKIISKKAAIAMALILLLLPSIVGIYLSVINPVISIFLIAGILSGILYSLPRYGFKKHALGDLSVFIIWGPGIFLGSYTLQGGVINVPVVLISFSVGILTANILNGNNWRDVKNDTESGIKTISSILNDPYSKFYYIILLWVPYITIIMAYLISTIFYPVLAVLISIPLAIRISEKIIKNKNRYIDILDMITARFTLLFFLPAILFSLLIYYYTGMLSLNL